MKRKLRFYKRISIAASALCAALAITLLVTGVFAETNPALINRNADYSIQDPSPVIYVAEKNAHSVVGVINMYESWNPNTREVYTQPQSEGSGVVIAEGGYILTNYHVIESGDAYQVLLPSGKKVDAVLTGTDASYDLAVLQITEGVEELTPATVGSVSALSVGSTVVAIGNPGGEALSNTVTSGYVSALERDVKGGNTSRTVYYLQHDAAINSGNSGGGLFDVNGNLVGINTLKYSGSYYSTSSYEGLGFAIPIDLAVDVASDLIQYGSVQRAALGVVVRPVSGAEEASEWATPAGLWVESLVEGGPAERAGVLAGDYITAINGVRVTTSREFTGIIDQYEAGDTVELTIARYTTTSGGQRGNNYRQWGGDSGFTPSSNDFGNYGDFGGFGGYSDFFDFFNDYYNYYFGGRGGDQYSGRQNVTCEILTISVTLEIVG